MTENTIIIIVGIVFGLPSAIILWIIAYGIVRDAIRD